jgi:hypothetical protein
MLIRTISALPGEQTVGSDGQDFTVPHGKVMVRGIGSSAIDSDDFGPVDMRDIVGRVTQINFSRDGLKICWDRLEKKYSDIPPRNFTTLLLL